MGVPKMPPVTAKVKKEVFGKGEERCVLAAAEME